jgi:hypothetical protein
MRFRQENRRHGSLSISGVLMSKEETIELAKRFLQIAGDGESEIRLLHEQADFA